MRYLVTGGSGFLGAHVVRALLARGHEVRAVVRAASPVMTLEGLPVERVVGSLETVDTCRTLVRGMDGILHVAGLYDSSPGGIGRMEAIHVKATRYLCEAAIVEGVPHFLLCSSSITLPYGPIDKPATEEDPDPFRDGCPYQGPLLAYYSSKKQGEALAQSYGSSGLRVVIVHPDFVVGAWDLKPTSGQMILQMARAPWIPFYPPGGKNFMDAEDCGLAHVLAMEKGKAGQHYFLGNENLTYHLYMQMVARVVGRPAPRFPLPREVGTLLGKGGDRLSPWLPPELASLGSSLVESMFRGRYRDPSRARTELGIPTTPTLTAIERAWRWFCDHGYVGR